MSAFYMVAGETWVPVGEMLLDHKGNRIGSMSRDTDPESSLARARLASCAPDAISLLRDVLDAADCPWCRAPQSIEGALSTHADVCPITRVLKKARGE